MFKRVFSLITFMFFSFEVFASSVGIRAIVNGDIITSYDVEERVKLSRELLKLNKYKMSDAEIEKKVLSEMIDDKIKVDEAKRFGIRITPEELSDATLRMEKYLNLPAGGYNELVKNIGIDKAIVNKQIEADVIWMKFVYSVLRSYVKVTDSELELLIENMKQEKQFNYEISSLIADKSKLEKLAPELSKISNCEDFISFAKKNGEAGSGAKFTILDSQMDKNLKHVIAHHNSSFPTKPVEINGNNTVFFICDKQAFVPTFTDEEKEEYRFSILQSKLDAFANKYFEKLKASSVIDIKD